MTDPKQIYRFLLKLYPARFREEYEAPLERQFRDEYGQARSLGARVLFWLRALADLATSVPAEFARELRQDLAYAVRVYRRRSLVTLLALTALALAIGVTTGVFSVLNALLIRSLPFRDPARLVEAVAPMQPLGIDRAGFYGWRNRSPYWDGVAAYDSLEMNLSRAAGAGRVRVAETSASFFAVLGVAPEFGRAFTADEDVPGKNSVAVIGFGLWQQMFGGDSHVLGAAVRVNGAPLTVVGVAPPGFDFPAKTAVWTPTAFDIERLPKSGAIFSQTIGRLKPGLTLAQANAIFKTEIRRAYPEAFKGEMAKRWRLISLQDQLAGPVREASLVLFGVVVLVLFIACANVAQLLLSRVTERRQEMAIRAALGASRARLVQQLITESIMLTMAAAAAGLAVAHWAARMASSVQPAQLNTQQYSILDGRVLGFAVAVAMITGVVFGVLPAWLMGRTQPAVDAIRAQTGNPGSGASRTRAALIAMQAAFTLVLLAGSITMGRSFLKLMGAHLGFRTQNVATFSVSLFGTREAPDAPARQFYRDALERLRAVPGVESAGAADYLPLISQPLMLLRPKLDSGQEVNSVPVTVTPGYFKSLGIGIVEGRDFTDADRDGTELVVIVNEEFARLAGRGVRLLGRKMKSPFVGEKLLTIVGVAGTTRFTPAAPGYAQFYMPAAQDPPAFATFVARVRGDPERYLAVCRDAIQQVDRQVPIYGVMTLQQRLGEALAKPRFYTTSVVFFAAFAMLLALIGIYGVASYSVSTRTHEIGVRIAVGASHGRLRFALLRQSMLPMAAGMVTGVAAAAALGRFLEHLMSGIEPVDAWICAAAALVLAMAAGVAVWTATARVLRVDPMRALRAD
jgi:putative ABC transport system permease protein